jgi:acetyltransferase-like isoleucine patch superfamily enzyme
MNKDVLFGEERRMSAIERFFRNHLAGFLARFRQIYWRASFANNPVGLGVCGKIIVRHPHRVSVGEGVELSEGVYINARNRVVIGAHTRLSAYVRINTGGLPIDVVPDERNRHTSAPVRIGEHVWLATGVTVNPGVTIHDGVVVGACSLVTRDLPAYTFCVGIPAKPIRELPKPEKKKS